MKLLAKRQITELTPSAGMTIRFHPAARAYGSGLFRRLPSEHKGPQSTVGTLTSSITGARATGRVRRDIDVHAVRFFALALEEIVCSIPAVRLFKKGRLFNIYRRSGEVRGNSTRVQPPDGRFTCNCATYRPWHVYAWRWRRPRPTRPTRW